MHVLHFYKTYRPDSMGGVEELIGQVCSGASKRGVTSEVLTVSRDTSSVDFGDHVHHRAKVDLQMASSPFSMAAFRRFAELARRADLIHYHFPWPFMDVVHFATRSGKPSLVTYHADITRQKFLLQAYKPLQKRFLRDVDRIVATSPNYLETSPVLRQYKDKVEVIPIGLDEHRYPRPDPARVAYWREQVGPKFFLFVGNLRYYKGLHVLLDALAGTSMKAVIIGAGPVEGELKAQATRLSLGEENLRFVGAVPDEDKVALLSLCYGLVFPSHLRSEAFGISLVEGAMFGKPLISTEIGTGTSFVNLADTTGLVVPPSDPAAFRGAMQKLWDAPELASRLGQQARQRFEQHLTSEQMVGRYVDLYQRLVGKARS
ncbi:glycosyltransferase family 4 protein [Burkholderia gladioli]|uniref:glycosyltransferase family 4 protein n=1 Tax=Burkholderia gladioli TaxID=28095 RepID=UPI0006273AFB|nr:glycosyltransferase family 4 protein [Burkholderia gladioli]KKJ07120.1 glycosyl transferase family 1 [Burkholderia gladioli]URV25608.1 glycosyltransferase family 4 protein [Burkholderia gladioli]